ncbi:hypothetical protein AOX56_19795 [Aeromonas sobria]|uniref:Uncharacterized protein n=1 Tax=Aeromonas sobria TaxID=646 RepID=A0A2N3ITV4_AERSO|nr:hypothetical protein [Aeromonas sobria]PKQ75321.1 hypothetical protein AOX56_19795 [Aeromonas sobria]
MIIGAARYQLVQPALGATRTSEYAEPQQKSIQLADDKVTLNSSRDDFAATYERPTLARKDPDRSLTQIAWDNLLAQRIGLSREKLDELEQKKKEIEHNSELSDEKKQQLLADLDKQKEELIKEAIERRQARGDEERQSNPDSGSLS